MESIAVPTEILKLIEGIDEFKGRWNFLQGLDPQMLSELGQLPSETDVSEDAEEEASESDTERAREVFSKIHTTSLTKRADSEVRGYEEAMALVSEQYAAMPPTEDTIKRLHTLIYKYSIKGRDHRGKYKKKPNVVIHYDLDGKRLGPGVNANKTAPQEVPARMHDLVTWYARASEEQAHDPMLLVGIFNVVFLAIHPFKDGNGRVARLLNMLLLLRAGYR